MPEIMAAGLMAMSLALRAQASSLAQPSEKQSDTPEVHLARGHEALAHNRYQEAEREFRAALALDPRLTVRARFPLAVTLFSLQEREEARQQFEAVRSQTGDDPNVDYYLGRLDLMEGKVDAAVHNLTLASTRPPFHDVAYYLGYACLKKGDFDSAEKWLKKAAESAPRDFRVQERLGLLYRAAGRQQEAAKAFARSEELHRSDVEATQLALECGRSLDTHSLDDARPVCEKLFDPGDVSKLVTLGTLYGGHGHYAEALPPFRRAAELDPDSYEMQYNLGLTYFRLKRYAEARAPLEKAVSLRPDVFEVNAPLGAALYALGDDAAAYRVLDRAHRLNPPNAEVSGFLFKVATSLAEKSANHEQYSLARQYLEQAVSLQPENPEPHRRLAQIYTSLGERRQAEKERQEAEQLSSSRH
jgi:Flp pilus assembly protein TadD